MNLDLKTQTAHRSSSTHYRELHAEGERTGGTWPWAKFWAEIYLRRRVGGPLRSHPSRAPVLAELARVAPAVDMYPRREGCGNRTAGTEMRERVGGGGNRTDGNGTGEDVVTYTQCSYVPWHKNQADKARHQVTTLSEHVFLRSFVISLAEAQDADAEFAPGTAAPGTAEEVAVEKELGRVLRLFYKSRRETYAGMLPKNFFWGLRRRPDMTFKGKGIRPFSTYISRALPKSSTCTWFLLPTQSASLRLRCKCVDLAGLKQARAWDFRELEVWRRRVDVENDRIKLKKPPDCPPVFVVGR